MSRVRPRKGGGHANVEYLAHIRQCGPSLVFKPNGTQLVINIKRASLRVLLIKGDAPQSEPLKLVCSFSAANSACSILPTELNHLLNF